MDPPPPSHGRGCTAPRTGDPRPTDGQKDLHGNKRLKGNGIPPGARARDAPSVPGWQLPSPPDVATSSQGYCLTKPDDFIGDLLRWLVLELLHDDADDGAVAFDVEPDPLAPAVTTLKVRVADDIAGLLIGKGGTLCAALDHFAHCASAANRTATRRISRVRVQPDSLLATRRSTSPRTAPPMQDVIRRLVSATLNPNDRDKLSVEESHDGQVLQWLIDGDGLRGLLLGSGGANVRAFDTIVQAIARARNLPKCRVNVRRDAPPCPVHVRRPLTPAARV